MAGVALGDINVRFAWHAWHLVTSTFTLRGKRGTYGTGLALVACLGAARHFALPFRLVTLSLCMAGVARMALGWLWWCAWARFSRPGRRATLHGRRGAWRHLPSLRVARVALGDIHLHFAWQAWHLVLSTFVLRGKRGT